ncbi:MAG: NPCBM/NEW2 domain-containing protein, partial [Planctomycetota bacterium]
HRAELVSIGGDSVQFKDGDADGKTRRAKLDDLVSYTRAGEATPPPHPRDHDVVVLLRGGDRIRGSLLPGKDEHVEVKSPIAGRLAFYVDDLAGLRFAKAWEEATEKPVFDGEEQDADVFVYDSLDRIEGTYLRTLSRAVVAHTRVDDEHALDFGKLLEMRFADAPAPEVPEGRLAEVRLTDGSRITAREISSDGKKLVATTLRDTKVTIALRDLLSVHQKGGRFVYLSDAEPVKTTIIPWIGETYAWDRPRVDRSFLDRPLRVGGEVYQKGIGVISGTSLTFRLDGKWRLFTSRVAVDDSAGDEGDVVFEVLVDGKSKYRSDTVRRTKEGGTPLRIPPVTVSGAEKITLRVHYVDDFVMDFADWIEPMLVK